MDTATTGSEAAGGSYVDWPSIFAGAVTAAAVSFFLLAFGSGVGLTLAGSPSGLGGADWGSLAGLVALTAVWTVIVQVAAYSAGGYLAGRMRRPWDDARPVEVAFRDGAHGVLVWALGVLLSALVLAAVTSQSSRLPIVPSASSGSGGALEWAVDDLLRPAQNAQRAAATTSADPALRSETARLLARALRPQGLRPADREYLVSRISTLTGAPAAEAQARLQDVVTRARTALERARQVGILAALLTAATLLVSAVAAWVAALKGGEHRERGLLWRGLLRRENPRERTI